MSAAPERPEIFHIVHVDRLASIIADGRLHCDAFMHRRSGEGTTIGVTGIKAARLTRPVHCHPGDCVGDYVPFYFCSRAIMLYVIRRGNKPELAYHGGQGPIVHLQADLHEAVGWANCVGRRWAFMRSNAGARYCDFFDDLRELGQVSWAAVSARNWAAADIREGKQAEFLMHSSFPWELVRRIGVHSRAVYGQVVTLLQQASHRPKIEIRPDWYY